MSSTTKPQILHGNIEESIIFSELISALTKLNRKKPGRLEVIVKEMRAVLIVFGINKIQQLLNEIYNSGVMLAT